MRLMQKFVVSGLQRWLAGLLMGVMAGGASAQPLSSLSHIHGIAVPQGQPEGLYLATQLPASVVHVTADGYAYTFLAGKGLMKVKEPGFDWRVVFNGFGEVVPVQMTSDRQNPNRLFVLDNQGHPWKSIDAGESWTPFA